MGNYLFFPEVRLKDSPGQWLNIVSLQIKVKRLRYISFPFSKSTKNKKDNHKNVEKHRKKAQ